MTKAKNKKRILITGFGPFPGQPENPSAELVGLLRHELEKSSGIDAHCVVLKTEYGAALKCLQQELHSFKPDSVICFGVSAGESGFRLEQSAHNRLNTTLPDASGYKPDVSCFDDGVEKYDTTVPIGKICEELNKTGIAARLSDDAGDYLCNFIYYHAIKESQKTPSRTINFVHIPEPDHTGTLSRADLLRGALSIVNQIVTFKNEHKITHKNTRHIAP
jgi:pyroglutamyl-peptidase